MRPQIVRMKISNNMTAAVESKL